MTQNSSFTSLPHQAARALVGMWMTGLPWLLGSFQGVPLGSCRRSWEKTEDGLHLEN